MQEKAKDLIDLIYDEAHTIGHWLGFTDLTPLHSEWLRDMIFEEDDETLLAHRGSYKTTCLSVAIALIMIIKPSKKIIFTRKTDDDVKEVIKQVAKILKSDIFKYFCKILYNQELTLIEESSFNITTNLSETTKGASQLIGLGIKTSMTGKHADFVFTDDIVNVRDRISKAERDLIKLQYQELQNIKNRGGRIFNTGTKWHKQDAIEELMPNKKIYTCYDTNLIAKENIQQLRESMTPSLFCANYELKHIADEDALFTNPQFESNQKLIFDGISHIDASYGGADATAFTIVKKLSNGNIIAFGKRWNKHVDDCLNEIESYIKAFRSGSISCEKNADKGYLAKQLRQRNYAVKLYNENMNKFLKITTYLRKNWKKIYFLEGTDIDYINEILDYTENAEHDDAPDSLASLLRQIENSWLV